MRTAALTLILIVATTITAIGQRFSLLPQVGFENSKTSLIYNQEGLTPLGVKFTPQVSLRLNYASKQGHGLFLGASTSRSIVSFAFTDPENGFTNFTANPGDMQLRLEGGYQFNSKKINLGKSRQASSSAKTTTTSQKSSCGSYAKTSCKPSYSKSHCGSSKSKQAMAAKSSNKTWMRIQPSVGIGYVPSDKDLVNTKVQNGQTTHEYSAGSWKTAFLAGAGFEFGKNNSRLFTVSVNYLKALGNADETLTTVTSTKTTITNLSSEVSAWNLRVGIPFTMGKTKQAKSKVENKKKDCQSYRIQYQYKCRGYN